MKTALSVLLGIAILAPLSSGCVSICGSDSGLKDDGSYYTKLEWSDTTTTDPETWVANVVDGNLENPGKVWCAPSAKFANAVLSFFGKERKVELIRVNQNIGTKSAAVNFTKHMSVYFSSDDRGCSIGDQNAKINKIQWDKILDLNLENKKGWAEFKFPKRISAKYIRIELEGNYSPDGKTTEIDIGEVKLYP